MERVPAGRCLGRSWSARCYTRRSGTRRAQPTATSTLDGDGPLDRIADRAVAPRPRRRSRGPGPPRRTTPATRTDTRIESGPDGTDASTPRIPASSDSLSTVTSRPSRSDARAPRHASRSSVAMQEALAARSSQPGDGADPPPPTPAVMSVVMLAPSAPTTRIRSPSSHRGGRGRVPCSAPRRGGSVTHVARIGDRRSRCRTRPMVDLLRPWSSQPSGASSSRAYGGNRKRCARVRMPP